MKKYLAIALLLAGFTCAAQTSPTSEHPSNGANVERLPKGSNPEPFAKLITAADLKEKLYTVASADMQGRETATEGQRKAAAFIESYFKSLGLKPGNGTEYQLEYPVYADKPLYAEIAVNEKPFQPDVDFSVANSLNHNSLDYFSEAVYVNLATRGADPFADLNLTGRLVVINTSDSGAIGLRALRPFLPGLRKRGVAAVLFVQGSIPRRDAGTTPRANIYTSLYLKSESPNIFFVSPTIGKAILGDAFDSARLGILPSGGIYKADVKLDFQKSTEILKSTDVLAVLPGTDKADEYVFVTGHYDHLGMHDGKIWFGADDDGSGTCAVLEMAKAFSKAAAAGKGPRRTIVFMTVSGEEEGLLGSAYYTSHPVYPLARTSVDLNIDMIGRIDPSRKVGDSTNYVYIIGDDKLSSDLAPITDAVNSQYTKLELDRKFNDLKDPNRFYYRSDHYNFADKGVPIIFYFNGVHADYHQPTDTPDKINYDLYARRARLVFYTAWDMANRDDMLKRDMPLR